MMSQQIIQSLAQLLKIQQRLQQLALEKTELIKKNELQQLEKLIKVEEKEVHLLEQAEQKRQAVVVDFMQKRGMELEEPTISHLVPHLSEKDRQLVEQLCEKLIETTLVLKEQNEFNELLTKQSLYFVNAQLAMLTPETDSNVTYQRPNNHKKQSQMTQSIFDSKA